jgi:hypothetical protein
MKKNKWDIIGGDIDKTNHEEHYAWFFEYWYDGGEYYDHYEHESFIDPDELVDKVYTEHISKRGGRATKDRRFIGGYIDMMSIYSPQVLRQRKIDFLLGIEKWEFSKKPTIGDIMKKNNLNNED